MCSSKNNRIQEYDSNIQYTKCRVGWAVIVLQSTRVNLTHGHGPRISRANLTFCYASSGFLPSLLLFMDYLRNLGSAAVSSLVQKSGLNLPFSLGPRVLSFNNKSIWALHDGTKRVRH